jgi:hypothetical protein
VNLNALTCNRVVKTTLLNPVVCAIRKLFSTKTEKIPPPALLYILGCLQKCIKCIETILLLFVFRCYTWDTCGMDNDLTIQLNLRINPVLKKTLELFAKKRLTTKSALLREALLDLFEKHGIPLVENDE